MTEVLEALKERLREVKMKKIFKSADLKLFFSDAYKLLFTPFCNSLGDENKRFPLESGTGPMNTNIPKVLKESVILPQAPNQEYLPTLFDGKKFQTKLLFRGSKDGFSSGQFHSLCDNKGPTLVLVKSRLGFYFGGFNSTSWINSSGQYSQTPNCFLFSLNHKTKHEIYQHPENAIYHKSDFGPTFGEGHDLHISSDCHKNQSSYSILGHTYKCPFGYNNDQSKNYLAGTHHFEVEDYEVFQLFF